MSTRALARELTLPAATALVIGQVIAVGIFLTPGTMIRTVASPLWILVVWALMGAMAVCGALCYGALAARYPQAGGGYVYLREAYGPRVAFLYGWKCFLVMDPGITAALAAGFASYAGYLLPLGPISTRLLGVAAIVSLALVHIAGRQARHAAAHDAIDPEAAAGRCADCGGAGERHWQLEPLPPVRGPCRDCSTTRGRARRSTGRRVLQLRRLVGSDQDRG